MDIYSIIRIYSITKSFYDRMVEIMRDMSSYGDLTIEDMSEFVIVLSETLMFLEDILDSVDEHTEMITDHIILSEFHRLLTIASQLEMGLENYSPIYLQ